MLTLSKFLLTSFVLLLVTTSLFGGEAEPVTTNAAVEDEVPIATQTTAPSESRRCAVCRDWGPYRQHLVPVVLERGQHRLVRWMPCYSPLVLDLTAETSSNLGSVLESIGFSLAKVAANLDLQAKDVPFADAVTGPFRETLRDQGHSLQEVGALLQILTLVIDHRSVKTATTEQEYVNAVERRTRRALTLGAAKIGGKLGAWTGGLVGLKVGGFTAIVGAPAGAVALGAISSFAAGLAYDEYWSASVRAAAAQHWALRTAN